MPLRERVRRVGGRGATSAPVHPSGAPRPIVGRRTRCGAALQQWRHKQGLFSKPSLHSQVECAHTTCGSWCKSSTVAPL
jgi:hypothetical protein